MEQKKAPQADIEQRRTTGFLLGLILVLAVCYVALEWNTSMSSDEDLNPIDLSELMHESELVPMSNEEVQAQLQDRQQSDKAEELRVVDDEVELDPTDDDSSAADADDESLLRDLQPDDKPLASLDVDPQNPLNFHIVEDLPQFPGGAVELMKWLTKNLKYPQVAQRKKVQGKVVAQFYVEKDGSISGIEVTQSLSPECDREALRVLGMMPAWKPGIQRDQPCRTKIQIPIVFKL